MDFNHCGGVGEEEGDGEEKVVEEEQGVWRRRVGEELEVGRSKGWGGVLRAML